MNRNWLQSLRLNPIRIMCAFITYPIGSLSPALCQSALFQDVAIDQGVFFNYANIILGNGISFYDFDNDGWDDLTLSRPTYETIIYKNIEGSFFPITQIPSGLDTKSVLWCDVNNDGLNDLITCSKDQGLKIFRNLDNGTFENNTQLLNWSFFGDYQLWGVSCSDINHDGLLDIYVCNYNQVQQNLTFINLGNFVFELDQSYFTPQFTRHSFQGSFIPLNEDQVPDLYVINDFYQGNNFYLSNASGAYEEQSLERNLSIPSDAMSNSWADFDHDGDWDLYVTNRFEGNRLMINDGNAYFTDEASNRNCTINRWCWSGLWMDYDNNGWEDLWITNESIEDNLNVGNHLLKNDNGLFSPLTLEGFANIDGYTSAKGDFNQDGLYDIAYQPESGSNFRLLKNMGEKTNHYIGITLHGVYSNKQAIGSVVQYYHQGEFAQLPIQIGENYLNQNSQHYILGMGLHTTMDSLIIHWPSGLIEKHFQLTGDENHEFHEGQTLQLYSVQMVDSCQANSGFWVQFHESFEIQPNHPEIQLVENNKFWIPSSGDWNFLHGIFPTLLTPLTISIQESYAPSTNVTHPTCEDSFDGEIAWYTPDDVWTNYLDSLGAGEYIVTLENGQCTWIDTIVLHVQETLHLDSIHIQPAACSTLNNGGIIPYYSSNAENVSWYIGDTLTNFQLESGTYPLVIISPSGCQIQEWVTIPNEVELPNFYSDTAHFCSEENLNLGSFTEQWFIEEWTLTEWEINATEDSVSLNYLHPNGCVVEHAMVLEWITPPNPSVDTLSESGSEFVQWEVTSNDSLPFDIYWEDGSTEWQNLYPCNDSTYFVLEYQDICAWTFPVYTICLETSIPQSSEDSMTWTFCSGSVYAQQHFNEEIWIYNALGQTLFWGLAKSHIPLEFSAQPRWVKTRDKIYPIQWCAED